MLETEKCVSVTGKLLKHSGVPRRYWEGTIDAVQDKRTRDKMVEELSLVRDMFRLGTGIFIAGRPCSGKTMFACMLVREALGYGARCFFTPASNLCRDWREKDIRFRILQTELLVIDNFGGEAQGPKSVEAIKETVEYRHNWKLPTVYTTNLAPNDCRERYGSHLMNLIGRGCGQKSIAINNTQFHEEAFDYEY